MNMTFVTMAMTLVNVQNDIDKDGADIWEDIWGVWCWWSFDDVNFSNHVGDNGNNIGDNDHDIGENDYDIGENDYDIGDNGNNIGDNDNEIDENDYDIGDNDNIKDDIGDGILAVLLASLQVPVHGSLLPESVEVFSATFNFTLFWDFLEIDIASLSFASLLKMNFQNYLATLEVSFNLF